MPGLVMSVTCMALSENPGESIFLLAAAVISFHDLVLPSAKESELVPTSLWKP